MNLFSKLHARLLVAVILGFSMAMPVVAEESKPNWSAWASLNLGMGSPYEMGAYASANVRAGRTVFRLRYTTSAQMVGNYNEDFGLLVGRVLTPPTSRGQFSVAVGGGLVQGSRGCILCGSRGLPDTFGLLIDAEGRVALTNFLGLSGAVFGDINSTESFGGAAFGLYLGGR